MSETPLDQKSSVEEIRKRFDADVERFSNLETGQAATVDAPLAMELITTAAATSTTPIERVLDIGCGAGNNSIKLLKTLSTTDQNPSVDLCDISAPMLEKAVERVQAETSQPVSSIHEDFRTATLEENSYDIILAAAVFHHLRDDSDWEKAFQKVFQILRPGGSIWISDLISHEAKPIREMMAQRYHTYLCDIGGENYAQEVMDYIDKEDSPRSLTYQLELLRKVGFAQIDVLHKNSTFAAFGAIK